MFGRMAAESSSPPVGEDNWVAYIDEARRTADDLEKRVNVIELYKQAISAEPGSVKIWLAYCEFFHSLYAACQGPSPPSWSAEEVMMGREVFSLDQDLDLWQTAYEDIRLRIGDSHVLWDRWVDVELEQLARTRTREGIERITLLYRDRLRTPHITWDETSQRFSSFLSEHNRNGWEATMKEVTETAQEAKAIVDARQRFEFPLQKAARDGNVEEERSVMREYLAWEIAQSKRKDETSSAVQRCRALFSRALAGVLTKDDTAWLDYIAYMSANLPAAQSVSSLLSPLQRAVDHCPWSGPLWSRYILAAEEAGLSFDDIEKVKHSATNNSQLYRDGLASLLEMYVAWCGYLKRIAMDPNASEEAVDVADVGLPAALESVGVLGNRLYGAEFQGDPDFRLERTYILYLTEKKGAIEEARAQWEVLARKQLYGDKYDFWRAYYLWEMQAFHMDMDMQTKVRSASGSSVSSGPVASKTPEKATAVLARAVNRKTLDWPERAIAVYLQHCNDYELPRTVRRARDNVHKIRIAVAKRREREAREAAAAYAYQAQVQADAGDAEGTAVAAEAAEAHAPESPSGTKRKREDTMDGDETASKRPKGDAANGEEAQSKGAEENGPKRDREHTSVLMTNLPADVTQTAIKKYLKDFGHIQNMTLVRDKDAESSTALIEFEDMIDAEDCVKFRDNKYLGESQIRVKSGAGLTLFVTNYPPAADDEYIRDLFKDCGEILSVRWPSLKFNTRRRFCYVSFRDQADAEKATKLAGRMLEGKYRLEVKYSDPSRRKKRSDAVSEKREVFVGNLDASLKEGDIQDVFGKYGAIVRVSIVGSKPGQVKGNPSAFVEYEKAEDAERAIAELHNTKLKSRVLSVVLARPKASLSGKIVNPDAPSGGGHGAPEGAEEGAQPQESGAPSPPSPGEGPTPAELVPPVNTPREIYDNPAIRRKVAVMNLPDTVNEARVLELAKPIGEVEKLVLQPRKGSAVVTFVDEAAAGRAMMGLDGKEWEGRRLKTGGMAELGKYTGRDASVQSRGAPKGADKGKGEGKGEEKKGKASLAPVNVRRPVLGGRGGKRGLGRPVASVASKDKSEKEEEGETDKAVGGGGKSNADFKAMFLGGGQS